MSRVAAGWVALAGLAAALVVALWPLSLDVRTEAGTGLRQACRTARLCDRNGTGTGQRPGVWKPDCGSILTGGEDRDDPACSTARRDRVPLLVTPLAIGVLAAGVIPALPRRRRTEVPGRRSR